jgi:transketolase
MRNKPNFTNLKTKAAKLRQETFNAFIKKGEAHLGGSFSMIEILLTIYEIILKKNDKFILSKAHASFPLSLLLKKKGFRPKLTTHLEIDPKNGIHCTTGSLGHGFPIATGMAFAKKKQRKKGRIFVMISDGECQEGTTWETFLIASKHKLDNLVLIIDYNKIQALSKIEEVLPLSNLKKKIESFNWKCINIKDGHSFVSLTKNFTKKNNSKKPLAFIVNTTKGKGIKEFENDPVWHAKKISEQDYKIGKERLGIE